MDLNTEQKKAVDITFGPAVVLAGPGSGKTAVITERTIKLIREEKIPAGNILVVTFTRAAAEEMKRRVHKAAANEEEKQASFGTFHSIFFKILRFSLNLDGSAVIRESDAHRYIGSMARECGLTADGNEVISEIRGEIAKVKSEGGLKDGYRATSCPGEMFVKIYAGYTEYLKKNRRVDFEDMLLMTERLFEESPETLDIWREKFRFIMIDEFQDINRLQYKLIRMLAEPENNLFIVGDDDQAIYGFRGSDPTIMLGFEKDYPGAVKIVLNRNYRSQENIVRVAGNLIRRNRDRFEKKITAVRDAGSEPDIGCFATTRAENLRITELIREYRAKGYAWRQMAIIYRTNRLAEQVASALAACGVPFSLKGNFQSIYSHFAVQDVLSYIKLALGDRKRETMLSVINRPKRYISREMFPRESFTFDELRAAAKGNVRLSETIDKLEFDLAYVKRGTPLSAIVYIRKGIGYDDHLREYASQRGMRGEEFLKVLDQMEEDAEGFKDFDGWFENITRIKSEFERRQDMENRESRDAVTITTMHGAKGLEYDIVFLPDANEGVTPYQKALTREEEEQERRMFYVAVTRAAQKLHVFSVRKLNGKEAVESRFIKEMLDFS